MTCARGHATSEIIYSEIIYSYLLLSILGVERQAADVGAQGVWEHHHNSV